ncbi:hypothetical protein CG51_17770 [Haematobacter missouriensis]|uniref:Uncharacterized protein n=3 Tax=Haematobacter TaxID=366614 RepID=A0A086XU09_9RHOB|nr:MULTISPECIES: hypothetical protein [Haematobacter]KFI24568.1 hypothetical protein CG51_17770 [Haematobacter missouriensis]KFI25509.1 hypothetical protein CN97_08225 [Haematobacter massiliensis]OWJ69566.1 hypothetical protein CDV50_17395 [Haematobacter massiliensis]OWJ71434.1 hypothetical protein CDV53_18665 [Haematobacter missouriensis]OWJ74989.1 hypothetical protein CDV49_18440 [Haematobacter genomosp. 1]
MSKNKSLIDSEGEVGDLGDSFFAAARRGRPALLPGDKKVRMNLMIDADIAAKLNEVGNKSAFVTEALRKALAG